jgi:hypothetical protein
MVINDLNFFESITDSSYPIWISFLIPRQTIIIVSTFGKFISVEANVLKLETLLLNGHVLFEEHTSGHHIYTPKNHIKPSISIPYM